MNDKFTKKANAALLVLFVAIVVFYIIKLFR